MSFAVFFDILSTIVAGIQEHNVYYIVLNLDLNLRKLLSLLLKI